MNQNLFLAILSMDSYNRGYGQSIPGLNFVQNITKIGNVIIQTDSLIQYSETGVSAGFYAISYNWNGSRIEMHRGTNPDLSFASADAFLNSPLVKDMGNGWTLGAGFAGASPALH